MSDKKNKKSNTLWFKFKCDPPDWQFDMLSRLPTDAEKLLYGILLDNETVTLP